MEFLATLWLPIVVSAVLVFVVSSIIHMALPIHKSDFSQVPGEAGVLDSMRSQGIQPGDYAFPHASSMKEMGTPEMVAKLNQGPVGFMTILPNGPMMLPKHLIFWFVYSLLISVFVAYLASVALNPGAPYLSVFRMAGTIAVLGYAIGEIPNSIWRGRSWSSTLKHVFDGVVYGLATAGTFAWLWPGAA